MTADLQKAMERAERLYPTAPHFRNAYVDGARVALDGGSRDACPYRPGSTWASAWRRAWTRGYDSIEGGEE